MVQPAFEQPITEPVNQEGKNGGNIIFDPFVRKILGPITVILFALTALPGVLAAIVILETSFFKATEPQSVLTITSYFVSFKGLPAEIVSTGGQALAALVAAICFTRGSATLTWAGRASFVLLILSVAIAGFDLFALNPDDPDAAANLTYGKDALLALQSGSKYSLSTGVTYLLLLAGLSI